MMSFRTSAILGPLLVAAIPTVSSASGLFGDWKTPDGSVVRTYSCAKDLCIKIVAITPSAPGTLDHNNPDTSLRNRSLCNLQIGSNFSVQGSGAATGGQIYDPNSGKTYKGTIDLQGDTLKLRGYVGISLFGRTETWQRTPEARACSK